MTVLKGIRIIEFEAIGPAPFGGMLLADMGADILRIDRPQAPDDLGPKRGKHKPVDILGRSRRSVMLDLKSPGGREAALRLMASAHVVIEGFRPGVMERLGLGPDDVLPRCPSLVYARMTGWGQDGPLAARAGHDLNYIALSGVLHAIGESGRKPVPPLNLVGDFGGGGMLLVVGVLGALLNVQRGGPGQVVDASMVEGAAQLGSSFWGAAASGSWHDGRASNIVDGGAPWYGCYETADGEFMSVAAVEERFWHELLLQLNLERLGAVDRYDRAEWPLLARELAARFRHETRDHWSRHFLASDACVAPVLRFAEAAADPHNAFRRSFMSVEGVVQPRPAPRFSENPPAVPRPAPSRGEGGLQALRDWGFGDQAIDELAASGMRWT